MTGALREDLCAFMIMSLNSA